MIPRRAVFYWEGGEMSWLRRQSLETFKSLNPTWEIVVIDGAGAPISGDSVLERVLRSDWARYAYLYDHGGLYLDTDIVFCKPIPDEWLESDMIFPLGDLRLIEHIAVIGSQPRDPFFALIRRACEKVLRADGIYNYQYFGVNLINRLTEALAGRKVRWIQPDSYLPVVWDKTEKLWEDGMYLSPLAMGVHWFGGDRLSNSMEPRCNEAWVGRSRCLVAQAIRSAWGHAAAVEAHHNQLGV